VAASTRCRRRYPLNDISKVSLNGDGARRNRPFWADGSCAEREHIRVCRRDGRLRNAGGTNAYGFRAWDTALVASGLQLCSRCVLKPPAR
jgi:hypothetical protein